MTLDLEERNSVQDEGENPPTKLGYMRVAETILPCKGDLIYVLHPFLLTHNGYSADLVFFYRYKGIQYSNVSLGLNTIESLFDLVKYGFWSGEAIPGVSRPVAIRVRTAYSIAAP